MIVYVYTPLCSLPAVITAPGQYRTRCGEVVTIGAASDKLFDFACRGSYSNGVAERWHRSGRVHTNQECRNDIVEAI